MAEQPISPYNLIQYDKDSRDERKDKLIRAINAFLLRQVRSLVANGSLKYLDLDADEDNDLVMEVVEAFKSAGWVVLRANRMLTFALPGKIIGDGNVSPSLYLDV